MQVDRVSFDNNTGESVIHSDSRLKPLALNLLKPETPFLAHWTPRFAARGATLGAAGRCGMLAARHWDVVRHENQILDDISTTVADGNIELNARCRPIYEGRFAPQAVRPVPLGDLHN